MPSAEVTRFAPSPTGFLHVGHAHSALFSARAAGPGGRFLLRIEDTDRTRCRPEYEAAIVEDLGWLGLAWEAPVRRQSGHFEDYRRPLDRLRGMDLVYPCFCTRASVGAEIAAALSAPHGPDGPLYPGTCRRRSAAERAERIAAGEAHAWRLDVAKAAERAGPLEWRDRGRGVQEARPETLGDAVLARKDTPASYHLAVCVDDALQGVTLVTRGEDLFHATHLHRLLQALLDLPVPNYHHHRLLVDEHGKRFAKRDKAPTLRALRASGRTAAQVRAMAGFPD